MIHEIALIALTFAPSQGPAKPSLTSISDSFEELASRINPAVIQILASRYAVGNESAATPSALVAEQRSRGSGVIVSSDGYIVTNGHVVAGARQVRVRIPQQSDNASILGTRAAVQGAQVVGIDLETDIAVLKTQGEDFPYLEIGDSDSLRPGELVFAFGSPLGLDNSVTMGVVSATARQLEPEDPMIYIQTDASINPGNSGGPLVDTLGHVVGINTMILSQSGGNEGLGFAAPSNIVKAVFEQIRATGRVRRGEIGVRAQTITPLMARGLELPRNWGVILSDVHPMGPAAAAGLEPGDIVLALDGKPMENGRQLAVNLYQRRIGDRVELSILRGTQTEVHEVEVVERQNDPDRFAGMVHPDRNLVPELGILGIDLDGSLAAMFSALRGSSGVIVAARSAQATSWEGQGLKPGDVIYAVNHLYIGSLAELKEAIARYRPGDPIVLLVERDRELIYVTLEAS
jgi:serine protease Do